MHSERYHVHFHTPNRPHYVDCEYVKNLVSDYRFKGYNASNIALPKRLLGNIGRIIQHMEKLITYSESESKSTSDDINVQDIYKISYANPRVSTSRDKLLGLLHFWRRSTGNTFMMILILAHMNLM